MWSIISQCEQNPHRSFSQIWQIIAPDFIASSTLSVPSALVSKSVRGFSTDVVTIFHYHHFMCLSKQAIYCIGANETFITGNQRFHIGLS